jgi:hypothetical protein
MHTISRRKFLPTAALATFAITMLGCAGVSPGTVLNAVAVAAAFAASVLGQIRVWIDDYFATSPNATLQATIDGIFIRAQQAGTALNALATGAADLTEGAYLDALAQFKTAYTELLAAIEGLPNAIVIKTGTSQAPVKMTTSAQGKKVLVVPPPSAFDAPKKK